MIFSKHKKSTGSSQIFISFLQYKPTFCVRGHTFSIRLKLQDRHRMFRIIGLGIRIFFNSRMDSRWSCNICICNDRCIICISFCIRLCELASCGIGCICFSHLSFSYISIKVNKSRDVTIFHNISFPLTLYLQYDDNFISKMVMYCCYYKYESLYFYSFYRKSLFFVTFLLQKCSHRKCIP